MCNQSVNFLFSYIGHESKSSNDILCGQKKKNEENLIRKHIFFARVSF